MTWTPVVALHAWDWRYTLQWSVLLALLAVRAALRRGRAPGTLGALLGGAAGVAAASLIPMRCEDGLAFVLSGLLFGAGVGRLVWAGRASGPPAPPPVSPDSAPEAASEPP